MLCQNIIFHAGFQIIWKIYSNLLQFLQTTLGKLETFILEHFDALLTLICNNSQDINFHFVQAQSPYYTFLKKYPW